MKFSLLWTAVLVPTTGVFGLQGNYLSQLSSNVGSSSSVMSSTMGSTYSAPPTTTDNFFPIPDEASTSSMSDLYSSAPPGAFGRTSKPAFVGSSSTAAAPSSSNNPAYQQLIQLWSDQVSVELSASQLYLSASIWFRERGMNGMSAWMLDESGEERGHGLAILEFGHKCQFPIRLQQLAEPKFYDWQTPQDVWEDILLAEQTNTQNLLRLAKVAEQCQEYACMAFLDPFHIEQLDAEDKVGGILAKVKGGVNLSDLDLQLGIEAEDEDHH